jgi:hypothetical protein
MTSHRHSRRNVLTLSVTLLVLSSCGRATDTSESDDRLSPVSGATTTSSPVPFTIGTLPTVPVGSGVTLAFSAESNWLVYRVVEDEAAYQLLRGLAVISPEGVIVRVYTTIAGEVAPQGVGRFGPAPAFGFEEVIARSAQFNSPDESSSITIEASGGPAVMSSWLEFESTIVTVASKSASIDEVAAAFPADWSVIATVAPGDAVPTKSWSTTYINTEKTITFSTNVTAADPPIQPGFAVMLAGATPLIIGDMIGTYSPQAGGAIDSVQVVGQTGQMISIGAFGDAKSVAAAIAELKPEEASDVFNRITPLD